MLGLSSLDREVINYIGCVFSSVYWEGVSRVAPEVESNALFNTFLRVCFRVYVCIFVCGDPRSRMPSLIAVHLFGGMVFH